MANQTQENKEEVKINIDDYIDFKKIANDYNLKSGDMSFSEVATIENILLTFITKNQ